MANSKNDDMDRSGNRIPEGSTPQSPQGRDNMNRDREQGGNQGRTGNESFNRDELERDRTPGSDSSRDGGREPDDISE